MHKKGLLCATAMGVATPLVAVAARAGSGDAVSLAWEAPAGCPGRDAILGRIRSLLVVSKATGEQVAARGTVSTGSSSAVFHLNLETVQGQHTWRRTMDGASCDELGDAAALIVALVVDPQLMGASPGESSAVPNPEEPVSSAPAPAAPPPPAPPPVIVAPPPAPMSAVDARTARRLPFALVLGATAVGDLGALPRASLGVEGALGVQLARVQIAATGTFFPTVEKVIAPDPDRGGDFWLAAGGLRACYVAPGAPWRWGLCGGGEAGTVHGAGFGTSAFTTSRGRPWGAARLGAFTTYAILDSLALRASLEGLVPVTRPEFTLENVNSVYKPAAVTGRLQIGLEAHFE